MQVISKQYLISLDTKQVKIIRNKGDICQVGDSLKLIFNITENNRPKNLSGAKIDLITAIDSILIEHKFDEKIVITDAENGVVEVTPKSSFNSSTNPSLSQLIIYDEDEVIFTQQFEFKIVKSLSTDTMTEAKNDIETLNRLHAVLVQYQTDLTGMEDRLSIFNERLLDIENGNGGSSVDLGNYYKKNETYSALQIDEQLIGKSNNNHIHTEYLTALPKHNHTEYVEKIEGMGLSTNDFTPLEKDKLKDLYNYTHPEKHLANIIIQDENNRFMTDLERDTWNNKSNFSGKYDDLTGKPTLLKGDKGDDGIQGIQGVKGNNGENYTLKLTTKSINDNTLNLGVEEKQYIDMLTNTTIILPIVTKYTEINLLFKCDSDLTITFPNIKWQIPPETKANKIYEYYFTWVNNAIGWLGGWVSYV